MASPEYVKSRVRFREVIKAAVIDGLSSEEIKKIFQRELREITGQDV